MFGLTWRHHCLCSSFCFASPRRKGFGSWWRNIKQAQVCWLEGSSGYFQQLKIWPCVLLFSMWQGTGLLVQQGRLHSASVITLREWKCTFLATMGISQDCGAVRQWHSLLLTVAYRSLSVYLSTYLFICIYYFWKKSKASTNYALYATPQLTLMLHFLLEDKYCLS